MNTDPPYDLRELGANEPIPEKHVKVPRELVQLVRDLSTEQRALLVRNLGERPEAQALTVQAIKAVRPGHTNSAKRRARKQADASRRRNRP